MLKRNGYTLIELLIGMMLSSIGILATTGLLATTTTHAHRLGQVSRLHDELNLIVSVLAEDIKNAGYDEFATQRLSDALLPTSPFKSSLRIAAFAGEAVNSCIIFSHDINANGELNEHSPNERRGYRLRDGAIEVRMSGRDCHQGGWQDLTSRDFLIIDQLKFTQSKYQHGVVSFTTITVELSASLASDTNLRRQVRTHIGLPNHNG